MTSKNNRAPLLSNIKLYVSFHHHMWIQTGVTVRKRLSRVVTSVTLTFDLRPWPFAWTLPWSYVITPEIFMMIRWWEHNQKGVTDRQTDGQTYRRTENTIHRAAWLQLKNFREIFIKIQNFSLMKIHLKLSSVKWRPFCPGRDELNGRTPSIGHQGTYLLSNDIKWKSKIKNEVDGMVKLDLT